MKMGAIALLCAWVHAAGSGCGYLELRAPGRTGPDSARETPIYLAYPDTLGPIGVRAFLLAPADKAMPLLKSADWSAKPLDPSDKRMLLALRDLLEGRVREAGETFAALAPRATAGTRSSLRVDRAVILFLAGFSKDAEKDWRGVLKEGSECQEVAWRNLYSLYVSGRRFDQANGLVEDILKGDPKNKWANAAKGYLLRMLMPGEDWEAFLKEKSSWKDSLFEIQIAYGKFLKDRGQWEEARKYYSRGLEGSPRNGPAWLELADVQYRLGYLVFAETCLRKAFEAGIADPYVFELYGMVLRDLSRYAASGRAMRELGYGWDEAWAARCWLIAERILENGFPYDLHSRSMAQLLYHLYCHNGKVEAAANLRSGFWFHFTGPPRPKSPRLGEFHPVRETRLSVPLGYVAFPLARAAAKTDFFEPF